MRSSISFKQTPQTMNPILKIAILCFSILFPYQQNKAQQKFTSYTNSYSGKNYEILLYNNLKNNFSLYIDAMSLDNSYEKVGITIDQNQYPFFLKAIAAARSNYQEWLKTLKKTNNTLTDKTLPLYSKAGSYFLYGTKLNFQYSVNLKFNFKILENDGETKCLMLIRTGELQSSSNQHVKIEDLALVFSSLKEIDDFTSAISPEKIKEYIH